MGGGQSSPDIPDYIQRAQAEAARAKAAGPAVATGPAAPPKIAPLPSPVPTQASPLRAAEQRRKKIAQARYGILSTIKTSPLGIVGTGAELGPGGGKKSLGV